MVARPGKLLGARLRAARWAVPGQLVVLGQWSLALLPLSLLTLTACSGSRAEGRGRLDLHEIISAEVVPYQHAFTYDVLPGSSTGTYFAAGALMGSTLATQLRSP